MMRMEQDNQLSLDIIVACNEFQDPLLYMCSFKVSEKGFY